VRESWPLAGGRRLFVTTDRLSAFDKVIGVVPHKGQVLNQLAAWWFHRTTDLVANHLIDVPDPNVTIAVEARPLPVEVVVRARLTGSTSTALLPHYLAGERELYGHRLPDGLQPHGLLPEPIITPTTKAAAGNHDEPITETQILDSGLVQPGLWSEISKTALALFQRGQEVAAQAGFVLADTKYEFGLDPSGQLLLIDEVHTPDSSRYWAADTLDARLAAGEAPDGYDKEPVRLALLDCGYDGQGDPPVLANRVWQQTSERYVHLFEQITGTAFEPGAQPAAERIQANLAEALS